MTTPFRASCSSNHGYAFDTQGDVTARLDPTGAAPVDGPAYFGAPVADDDVAEDPALGECPQCGSLYFTEGERAYHADSECIGGDDRWSGC